VLVYYLRHLSRQLAELGKALDSLNVYLQRIDATVQVALIELRK
jgi:hypothetical protein